MLNCIAICRCMDKKPCGNTMKANSVFSILECNVRGGVSMTPDSTMEIAKGVAKRPVGINDFKQLLSSPTKGFATVNGTCAVIEKPASLGKPLPLCRVTGTEQSG